MKLSQYFENKKQINVGFFGGSITEGAGASQPSLRYSTLVTRWLSSAYPNTAFTEVNASIGGTGSDLGAFRLNQDLLTRNPDLIFVEFAVNDGDAPKKRLLRSMEGIVRQIRAYRSICPIVFVYTLFAPFAKQYENGETPSSIQAHEEVAAYYEIPSIHVGKALFDQIQAQHCALTEYLPDTTHPNDKGYQVYADEIARVLPHLCFSFPQPAPMCPDHFGYGDLLPAHAFANHHWKWMNQPMQSRYPDYIESDVPGASICLPFQGRVIGVYCTIEKDSGRFLYSIDGAPEQEVSCWDSYALRFDRAHYRILADQLQEGSHVLTLRVSGNKDEQSLGNMIRIGAFLVEKRIFD